MVDMKCDTCGNSYHCSEAFSKFGFDDGDGEVKTPLIAQALEVAGHHVKYSRWSPHNTIIYSVCKDGIEYMPVDNPQYRIGYNDPMEYLPADILNLLDEEFPSVKIFTHAAQDQDIVFEPVI